jgi:predicted HicB family RNase H-like nuclease
MMEYQGYLGKVEFDDEANLFHGQVVNIRDVVTFQGESVAQLRQSFRDSIDDYLEFCKERGEAPDKPFSGQFVARIPPDLHRQASTAASVAGQSLNAWLTDQIRSGVAAVGMAKPTVTDRSPAGRKKTAASEHKPTSASRKQSKRRRQQV